MVVTVNIDACDTDERTTAEFPMDLWEIVNHLLKGYHQQQVSVTTDKTTLVNCLIRH